MKARFSSNIGLIPPPTTELAALEHLKINVSTFRFSVAIDLNFLNLSGNENIPNILEG